MHGRDTDEPTRSPLTRSASGPVTIDAVGVADAVAQIQWVDEVEPPPTLRLIIGGAQLLGVDGAAARVDTDRWINEGGSVEVETPALLRVVT